MIHENEPGISTPGLSKGRSQSMRHLSHQSEVASEMDPLQRAGQSSSSASKPLEMDTKPNLVTFALTKEQAMREINRQRETAAEANRLLTDLDFNIQQAMEETHSTRLNPARDGVYARARNIFMRFGVPIATGSAIGFSVFELMNATLRTSTTTTTTQQAIISITNSEIEEIM